MLHTKQRLSNKRDKPKTKRLKIADGWKIQDTFTEKEVLTGKKTTPNMVATFHGFSFVIFNLWMITTKLIQAGCNKLAPPHSTISL